MWECGLKPIITEHLNGDNEVTPHVGVWIETLKNNGNGNRERVTPHVGVWIETS